MRGDILSDNILYSRTKELRKKNKLSQDELAKRCGYTSRSTISKLEKGEFNLPSDKITLLATALNTTPAYLMGWEDKQKSEIVDEELIALLETLSDEQKTAIIEFIKQMAK